MFSFRLFRDLLFYGLLAGVAIVVFAALKNEWYLTRNHPDLYITVVALVFAVAGFIIKPLLKKNTTAEKSTAESRLHLLSKRESTVLEYLYTDLSNKEIADRLCIGMSTLKTHINGIYRKLEVGNRKELRLKYEADRNSQNSVL